MRSPLPLNTTILPDEMPEQYVLKCDGGCMDPEIQDGERVLISSTERYNTGDYVIIFIKPERVAKGDHQLRLKKLIIAPPPSYWRHGKVNPGSGIRPAVIVEMLNPHKILYFDVNDLLGLHKCLGPVPVGLKTYRVTDQQLKQMAAGANRL
jgi:hypothetical protein